MFKNLRISIRQGLGYSLVHIPMATTAFMGFAPTEAKDIVRF